MATLSHIPNPVSIAVRTAGYTIPANRYARATVNLEGSATFTINGNTAIRGTQNSVITANGNLWTSSGTPNPTGGNMPPGTLNTASLNGTIVNNTATFTGVYANATDQKTVIADIYLPTGTVINGTGTWRAVVEEYRS